MLISFQSTVCDYFSKLKEKAANATELQHQLDKMKQQHQEQQNLQQSTTSKLREAQVREVQKRYTVSSVQKIMGHSFILH